MGFAPERSFLSRLSGVSDAQERDRDRRNRNRDERRSDDRDRCDLKEPRKGWSLLTAAGELPQ